MIKKSIASCVRNTMAEMKVSLLICLTETGSTVSYLSGYNLKCPILAICSDDKVARTLLARRGVFSLCVGSLVGYESVISK